MDDDAWNTSVTGDDLDLFEAIVCGPDKGYDQLVTMIGDAWGDGRAPMPNELIQDMPAPPGRQHRLRQPAQRQAGPGTSRACNNFRKGTPPHGLPGHERGAGRLRQCAPGQGVDLSGQASTILHEMTHLVNFYQRSLMIGSPYDTWLEEMSAMMTEDIIAPAVSPGRIFNIPRPRAPSSPT